MNLNDCNKGIFFAITLLAFIFFPVAFPSMHLFYFVPFIILSYYQFSYIGSLWISLACGTIIDCFSVHSFFGLNAFVYCLTTSILYRQQSNFFADRLSTLPLMTSLFSVTATLILMLCASILERKQIFSFTLFFTDLFIMPFFDSLYAFLFFVLPFQILRKISRQGKRLSRRSRR